MTIFSKELDVPQYEHGEKMNIHFSRECGKRSQRAIERKCEDLGRGEYRAIHEDDILPEVTAYIKESLWSFVPQFLSSVTHISMGVFTAIEDNVKCEDNNEAILSIVKGTCGLEALVNAAIDEDGEAAFLNHYDSSEYNITIGKTTWYIYPVS